MQLPEKQKTFSEFIAVFLKSTSNFEHFEEEYDLYSPCLFKIMDCERSC